MLYFQMQENLLGDKVHWLSAETRRVRAEVALENGL